MNKDKYLIFHIEGGQGKVVMSTAVIRAIKKKFPERKIIVTASWDGPLFYNPNIHRFFLHGESRYFFEDYINDDTIIYRQEPYHSEDHILNRKHLTKTWCDMYNVSYDGYLPEIYLNPREIEIAKDKIKPDGRPIMLLQTNGGGQGQYSKKSWARDIPVDVAQKVVNHFSKTYRILHIRREDQPALNNTEFINLPLRELYAVFPLSQKRLFMDSFSQHLATGLGLQSVVCWVANKPEIFGYEENINILPNAKYSDEFTKYSYLEKFSIDGQIQQFPYDNINLFNVDEIIDAINQQK